MKPLKDIKFQELDSTEFFYLERLFYMRQWVIEREKARKARESGKPPPWTRDPIIQTARFCNVRRMDDRVSKWLLEDWYPRNTRTVSKGQMLATAGLARLVNWPEALAPLRGRSSVYQDFNYAKAHDHFESIKARGGKVFTGAYIINASGHGPGVNKVDVVLDQVQILRDSPDLLDDSSMSRTHSNLQKLHGIGSFIAGQIVADLRHVWPGTWADSATWAPLGPGSRRGIAWLQGWNGVGDLLRASLKQSDFEKLLIPLVEWFKKDLKDIYNDRGLEAMDIQNCLCETDKYFRLMNGTGRAKNRFAGV